MRRTVFRCRFEPDVPMDAVEDSVAIAWFAAEGIHGAARVRNHAAFLVHRRRRTCLVEASTKVGRTIAKVFAGLLRREFGEDGFRVERIVEITRRCPRRRLAAGARR